MGDGVEGVPHSVSLETSLLPREVLRASDGVPLEKTL